MSAPHKDAWSEAASCDGVELFLLFLVSRTPLTVRHLVLIQPTTCAATFFYEAPQAYTKPPWEDEELQRDEWPQWPMQWRQHRQGQPWRNSPGWQSYEWGPQW